MLQKGFLEKQAFFSINLDIELIFYITPTSQYAERISNRIIKANNKTLKGRKSILQGFQVQFAFRTKLFQTPWSMLFNSDKVLMMASVILFKIHSAYCDLSQTYFLDVNWFLSTFYCMPKLTSSLLQLKQNSHWTCIKEKCIEN